MSRTALISALLLIAIGWHALASEKNVRPARPIFVAVPDFPEAARRIGAAGVVVVMVTLDQTGLVSKAEIVRSETIELLEKAALEAAYKSRFEPRLENGRPVVTHFQLPYRFPTPPRASILIDTLTEFAVGDTMLVSATFIVEETTELRAVFELPGNTVGSPYASVAGELRALRRSAVWDGIVSPDAPLVLSQRFVPAQCGSDSIVAWQPYMTHATLARTVWPVCIRSAPGTATEERGSDPCCQPD